MTRRQLMRRTAAATAGIALMREARWLPSAHAREQTQQPNAAGLEAAAARRAEIAKTPVASAPLAPTLTLLSGPGGNIVVFDAGDRKIVIDSFVRNAWRPLKQAIDAIGRAPVKLLIDTHWHFDHTDNNENFRAAGADVLAHTNTKKRLSQPHDVLGMHFDPAPLAALPNQVFSSTEELHGNGETIELGHIPAAHTDSDIYIRFLRSNVLQLGDVFFNEMYPFIDTTTGGTIGGMIAGATKALTLADDHTKIVPGHGAVGDRAALTHYRDMLTTVRDRVAKLKKSGRTLQETVAEKPTADLDPTWAKGFTQPDMLVTIVYNTL
jgi:cyclase